MSRLKAAIIREYEDDPQVKMEVYNPRNTQTVELYFRGEKTAKVLKRIFKKFFVTGMFFFETRLWDN